MPSRKRALPEPGSSLSLNQRITLTLLFTALVAVSWTGILESTADRTISNTLQRALVTAAIARGLNGVISVAQGTEIAIQPVGVGVTITAGQILDPLNDLVERFSWLALAASASLGTQILMSELLAEPAVNIALTTAVGLYLLALWWPRNLHATGGLRWLLRLATLFIFLRFLFTGVTLVVGWVDHWVLQERQALAIGGLTQATREIEALEQQPAPAADSGRSMLDRFEAALDSSRDVLDIEARLNALQTGVEESVAYLMDLIVLFLVQTLVLPLGAFYLALSGFRWFWRWSVAAPT